MFVWLTALKKKLYASTSILSLITLLCLMQANSVSAQQDNSGFSLSMPVEYVNYTIVSVNGCLWAKIDGAYPIRITGDVPDVLPMVYPTPPQTTNIHITLGGKEIAYSNYNETNPTALHHTAIGDWAMVAAQISPVNETFTLGIHYEQPLQTLNGSCLFLYDLNISPYLTAESSNSTAHFSIRVETNVTDIKAFTTETDTKWNTINYSLTKEGNVTVASVVLFSEYNKPLLGDLVVEFSDSNAVPEFHVWVLAFVVATASLVLLFFKNRLKTENSHF